MPLSSLNHAATGKRERKRAGNDGKGEAVSLRSFFFIDPCAVSLEPPQMS